MSQKKKKNACLVFDTSSTVKNLEFPDTYVLPLIVTEQNHDKTITTYRDNEEINNEQLYQKLVVEKKILKTSQSLNSDTIELFKKLSQEYQHVFYIAAPIQITEQYNTKKQLLEEFANVKVYVTSAIGTLSYWTAEDLAKANQDGILTDQYIQKYLSDIRYKRFGILCVPDFIYLARGGRIKKMTSILASMLKFIILISWDERGLVQFNKTRDRNKLCSLIFDGIYTCNADKVKYEPKNVKRVWYGVSKFSSEKFKIDELLQELKAYKKFPNAKEYIDSFPSVIECHTGPNYIIVGVEIK